LSTWSRSHKRAKKSPFIVFDQDIDECVLEALDAAAEMDATVLSQNEAAAIHLYTQPSSLYKRLNEALRSRKVAEFTPFARVKSRRNSFVVSDFLAALLLCAGQFGQSQDSSFWKCRLQRHSPRSRLRVRNVVFFFRCSVCFGFSLTFSKRYPPGKLVVWRGFSSTSVDRDVAVQFAGNGGTLFELPAELAVNISNFSALPDEAEAVVPGFALLFVCLLLF
jgi:hypothetical protein